MQDHLILEFTKAGEMRFRINGSRWLLPARVTGALVEIARGHGHKFMERKTPTEAVP